MQDQSSSKVMGWDCGAVRPAEMHVPYQTQLGRVGLKCAPVKAGTSVMQVERACAGMGTSFCRAGSQGSLQFTLGAGRTGGTSPLPCLCPTLPWQSPRGGRRCSAEEGGEQMLPAVEQELASERPHLCPTGSQRPFLAACRLSPAASPPPAGRHRIPRRGREQGGEGWAAERTSSLGPLIQPSRAAGCSPAPRVKRVFKLVLVSWTPSR